MDCPPTPSTDEASLLAMRAQRGARSHADYERLGEITLRHCRIESSKQVRTGLLPVYDCEICATEAAAKCFSDGLPKFDAAKASWGTYCQRICAHYAADMARDRTRQQLLAIQALNAEAERDNIGGIDWWRIMPPPKIRRNPDAQYEWDEQIGRWQADGIVPSHGELQALKLRLMRDYNL